MIKEDNNQNVFHYYSKDLINDLEIDDTAKYIKLNLETAWITDYILNKKNIFSINVKDSKYKFTNKEIEFIRNIEKDFFNIFFERNSKKESITDILKLFKNLNKENKKMTGFHYGDTHSYNKYELDNIKNRIFEFNKKSVISFEKLLIMMTERIMLFQDFLSNRITKEIFLENLKYFSKDNNKLDAMAFKLGRVLSYRNNANFSYYSNIFLLSPMWIKKINSNIFIIFFKQSRKFINLFILYRSDRLDSDKANRSIKKFISKGMENHSLIPTDYEQLIRSHSIMFNKSNKYTDVIIDRNLLLSTFSNISRENDWDIYMSQILKYVMDNSNITKSVPKKIDKNYIAKKIFDPKLFILMNSIFNYENFEFEDEISLCKFSIFIKNEYFFKKHMEDLNLDLFQNFPKSCDI